MTPLDRRVGRRGWLALVGSATLAGCNGVPFPGREPTPATLDGAALRALGNAPAPTVRRPMPVDIERAYLDDGAARARSLLSDVPSPISEHVPNEAVAEELDHCGEEARSSLDAAADAPTRFEAMGHLRDARAEAAFVAGAWAAFDEGRTRADVFDRAESVREAAAEFAEGRTYAGEDPAVAVVVHAAVERLYAGVGDRLEGLGERRRSNYPPGHALAVGDVASRVEAASAALDDARYLSERFAAGLDDPTDLRASFESTASTVRDRLRSRWAGLPDAGEDPDPNALVDRDVSDTPAANLLRNLYEAASRATLYARPDDLPAPARRVLFQHDRHATVDAFETARERVNDGETFTVDSAGEVREYRSRAVEAVERARGTEPYPLLTRHALAGLDGLIGYADEQFEWVGEAVRVESVERPVARYVETALTADAVPAASRAVGSALTERT